jgi:hypothetical protein
MPLFPTSAAEARQFLHAGLRITVVWCEACRRLVIPLDRFQQFCPEDGRPLENSAPRQAYDPAP